MNGATAEPLVSTMRPPMRPSITTTGSSQYFLRTRRKSHSSPTMLSTKTLPSELLLHLRPGGSGRITLDPVGARGAVEFKAQRVLAGEPHDEANRHDRRVEHDAHDDRAHHSEQEQAEPMPDEIERAQRRGPHIGASEKCPCPGEPIKRAAVAAVELERGDESQHHREGDAQVALARARLLAVTRQVLVEIAPRHSPRPATSRAGCSLSARGSPMTVGRQAVITSRQTGAWLLRRRAGAARRCWPRGWRSKRRARREPDWPTA